MTRMSYACDECKKYIVKTEGMDKVPECCGKRMRQVPLTECTKDPSFAEHARFEDDDEPCDPGISGL